MFRSLIRMLGVVAALAAIVGAAAYEKRKEPPAEAPPNRPVLDNAATQLPAGVRDGWVAALDRTIERRLSVHRQWLVVRGTDVLGEHGLRYVPLSGLTLRCQTIPFEIGLEMTGTSHDRDGDIVSGFSATLVSEVVEVSGEPVPAVGVGAQSPAAKALLDELCRHLADRIDTNAPSAIRGTP